MQKRIAAIHDISCFGRCSLTVALPIISSAGIECSVIPTAVLSTHTGGFDAYTYRDLTEDISPVSNHWHRLGLGFDAIYTGFLGSFEQLGLISDFIERFSKKGCITLVDPVMADNGQLYKIFSSDFPKGMQKLCEKADIIVPNITEAVFLLSEAYKEGPYTEEYIKGLLKKLSVFGCKKIVLTGISFDDAQLGAAAYDCITGDLAFIMETKIEGFYHGTGDVFGSTLISALTMGCSLNRASEIAVGFTVSAIKRTKEAGTDVRYGVNFEEGLHKLYGEIQVK